MKKLTELNKEDIDKIIHLYLNGFDTNYIAERYDVSEVDLDQIFTDVRKFQEPKKLNRKFYNIDLNKNH